MRPSLARRIAPIIILLCCSGLSAEERILSFASEITVARDGSMLVLETIRVWAQGGDIRRGIYRDFPTHYTDRYGNHYKVDFEILEVTRNNSPEPWRSQRRNNGVRTYLGSPDVLLEPGVHSYTLLYQTRRQLGFFEDHDELYWNVTGSGWAFPIQEASAVVTLPEPVTAADVTVQGYTGSMGSKEQRYTAAVKDGGIYIRANRILGPGEGLTLVASWPKDIVDEPTRAQRFVFLLQDNRGLLLALAALLFSGLYLQLVWSRYGRDPAPGVVFPRYKPPAAYSPASARYISRMGYDGTVLAAAVINLAVKGYVTITKTDDDFQLQRKSSKERLAPGESALFNLLFVGGPVLALDNDNYTVIGQAKSAHKRALERDYQNIYFRLNMAKIVPSLLGSSAVAVIIGLLGAFTPLVIGVVVLTAILHALYVYLLRAPTPRGRLLLDKLMGFKLYLDVAERDDLERSHRPEKTPELFERFLPYAVALGVEQAWAEQFDGVFERLGDQQGAGYKPLWYSGQFDASRLSSFAGDMGASFSSAISSASTPPGSTSGGGGGGSSGGGGGGGGGGGW